MAITNSFFPSQMLFCYSLVQQPVKVKSENQVENKVQFPKWGITSLDIMPMI